MAEMEKSSNPGQLFVSPNQSGKRLDQILPGAMEALGVEKSRSQIQALIKDGAILLNRKKVKPKALVSTGDVIDLNIPPEKSAEILPEAMDLVVLFEDDHLIVIDKAPGIVVHPGSGNDSGTLVNGLLHHCRGMLSQLADKGRPGIVHRLDKETSGCLVAAKSDLAYESLVGQFSNRETKKWYVAIASGIPAETEGLIENQIGRHPVNRQKMAVVAPPRGKLAITSYKVSHCDEKDKWSWIDCQIHTGRTHQIRVHLKESLHCPILGDTIYAQPARQKTRVERLMLHARELVFRHPETGREMRMEAPIPECFGRFMNR